MSIAENFIIDVDSESEDQVKVDYVSNRSLAWNYFTGNPGGETAKCNLCKTNLSKSGSTKGLLEHFKRKHDFKADQLCVKSS
jgi:hypothetical protein